MSIGPTFSSAYQASRFDGGVIARMGAGGATVTIYTAPRPSTADGTPGAATVLAEATLANPPASLSGQTMVLAVDGDATVTVSGTAAWARVKAADGQPMLDLPIYTGAESGLPADGYLQLSALALAVGDLVRLGSIVVS